MLTVICRDLLSLPLLVIQFFSSLLPFPSLSLTSIAPRPIFRSQAHPVALVLPGLVLTAVCFRLEDNSHMTTRVYLQEVNTSLEYSIPYFFFPPFRFVPFLIRRQKVSRWP